MRLFQDPEGQRWQAAPLDASYGHIMLVFDGLEGGGIRQRQMLADTLPEAERELAELDDDALRAWLQEAQPWDYGAGKL